MRKTSTLREDDRAIEGLPIRLIIALVVGVASLTLMMGMLGGFGGGLQKEEVSAELSDEVVQQSNGDTVTVTVVNEKGEKVEGATVLIKSGTATVPGGSTDISNTGTGTFEITTSTINNIDLNKQNQGKIIIEVIPPSDGNYKNDEDDGGVVVLDP
ncbi:hypothetical protein G9C85_04715 [Halorubellus sp. JP-L1]|uniref:DUF7382 domain-containing protein n=1 Tax=Halorubellus sp. JP-L1 TaxID=2715753 RepID=UPI0014091013|nr:hypothetical protein [Halorubellus sp. JP-L1]NHN40938.1 hypothetical protein [Halorubellus sp. JP-L1]